ncbi:MAG: prepilin-type N-terminal cleavage/methylation domain-containing protein [bacterium]
MQSMRKKAFTLIEMLIVVVIIGILAAALIPRLASVQARARDTKRKADLHQIGVALGIYKQDHGGTITSVVRIKTQMEHRTVCMQMVQASGNIVQDQAMTHIQLQTHNS